MILTFCLQIWHLECEDPRIARFAGSGSTAHREVPRQIGGGLSRCEGGEAESGVDAEACVVSAPFSLFSLCQIASDWHTQGKIAVAIAKFKILIRCNHNCGDPANPSRAQPGKSCNSEVSDQSHFEERNKKAALFSIPGPLPPNPRFFTVSENNRLTATPRHLKSKASHKHPKEYKQARARYPSPEY